MSATINQPYIFLATVYGGLVIGLLYGAVTVLRRLTHAGKCATLVWDILFFAAATLGIPQGTLMSRLSRARATLRAMEDGTAAAPNHLRIVGGTDEPSR